MLSIRRGRMRVATRAGAIGLGLLIWSLLLAPVASASGVSGVSASLSATQAGASSTYSITFTATHGLAGGDEVIVFAHSGTVFPSPGYTCSGCAPDLHNYSLRDNVRYHDMVLSSVSFNVDQSIAYIMLAPDDPNYPNDVPPMRSVTLTVTGVTNPAQASAYTMMIATTGDQTQVRSNTYSITPGPAAGVAVSSGSGQSATVESPFASTLQATVVDQYGNVVSGGGQQVTFTAPSSGPSGTFAAGSLTDTATADTAGVATSSAFSAGTQAGTYSVQATIGTAAPSDFALANVAGPPTQLSVSAGNNQSGPAGQPFATRLAASLLDRFGNPVSEAGQEITFTAPATGAGGTFAGTGTNAESDTTDASGTATSSSFTANGTLGSYSVLAAAAGLGSVSYSLTNIVGPPDQVVIESGDRQSAQAGSDFAQPLQVEVTDSYGHPLAGQTVTFTVPGSGPSATFAGGKTSDTETTNTVGIATSAEPAAGQAAGSYTVQATTSGLTPADFSLANTAGAPAQLVTVDGNQQTATVGQPFAAPLRVQLVDRYGNPVQNVNITFTAPFSGPSATFAAAGSNSQIASTNSTGVAISSTVVAGAQAGAFTVMASASGVPADGFSLTDLPAPTTGSNPAPQAGPVMANTQAGTVVADSLGTPTKPERAGSTRFAIKRIRLNRREGTATVTVMLPSPGTVTLSGHQLRFVRVRADRARRIVLAISPNEALKRKLRTHRRARITLRVRYAPAGGAAGTLTRTITLRES